MTTSQGEPIVLLVHPTADAPLRRCIAQLDDLQHLFSIQETPAEVEEEKVLLIKPDGIHWPLFWHDRYPPFLIPPQPLEAEILAAFIRFLNDPHGEYLSPGLRNTPLGQSLQLVQHLIENVPLDEGSIAWLDETTHFADKHGEYYRAHNRAVIYHYGTFRSGIPSSSIEGAYQTAIAKAPHPELKAYTLKHFSIYLMDQGRWDEADSLIDEGLTAALSKDAEMALKDIRIDVVLHQFDRLADATARAETKSLLREAIEYYAHKKRHAKAGMHYLNAATVAMLEENYSEALSYTERAIKAFDQEGVEWLRAEALRKKAEVLTVWGQEGHPQFYYKAIETYKKALKTFTRETAPDVFAEIHHQLGIIYAALPVEPHKRGIMAGLSQNAFQTALHYFTPQRNPFMHATICNHFGNALCQFPPSRNGSNFSKAMEYYEKALEIFDARHPFERASALLNYINAAMAHPSHPDPSMRAKLRSYAEEVLHLPVDGFFKRQAQQYLAQLAEADQSAASHA